MMSREQRMEYEILYCALNRATHSEGYASTVAAFTKRLREYFPDIQAHEFVAACKHLVQQGALNLQMFKSPGPLEGLRDYRGDVDDALFFDDIQREFYLRRTVLGQAYCDKLSAHIEAPPGFRSGVQKTHAVRRW